MKKGFIPEGKNHTYNGCTPIDLKLPSTSCTLDNQNRCRCYDSSPHTLPFPLVLPNALYAPHHVMKGKLSKFFTSKQHLAFRFMGIYGFSSCSIHSVNRVLHIRTRCCSWLCCLWAMSSELRKKKTKKNLQVGCFKALSCTSSLFFFMFWYCWAFFVRSFFNIVQSFTYFFLQDWNTKFRPKWPKSSSPGPSLCYVLFTRIWLICQTLLRVSKLHQFHSKTNEE